MGGKVSHGYGEEKVGFKLRHSHRANRLSQQSKALIHKLPAIHRFPPEPKSTFQMFAEYLETAVVVGSPTDQREQARQKASQ